MLEKLIKEPSKNLPIINVFEPIWGNSKFVIPTLEKLKFGDQFVMGDLGYREYFKEFISEKIYSSGYDEPYNFLDLGCGNMRFTRGLTERYINPYRFNYTGIDQMDFSRETSITNASLIQYDLKKFEKIIRPQSQDLVLCAGLIHYLPKVSVIYEVLRQSYNVLKPGGLMMFNLPHPDLYDPDGINNKVNTTWMYVKPRIDGYQYEMKHFDSLGNTFTANILKLDLNDLNKYLRFLGFKILKIEVRKNPLEAFEKNQHLQQLKPEELKKLSEQNAHILYFIQKPNL